ncbi:Fic family protein [Lysobacter silvisoli]|uniref:Fic family protein n=1 Tax=Lysobacter silvisoli TaxID=2293254 RepID=A0A371K086_9GAMM|nr:Fic/DOC family N-terminal domain-containing protein [Lysobacter silvisoli]RDZ27329.1 Fic family protein [Lysobacter silvisoli]
MRLDQIAPALRGYLVPLADKPSVRAMVAPPVPRQMPSGGERVHRGFTQATLALGRLEGAVPHWQNPDLLTRTLARREAVQSSQIEGTRTDLDQLLTYEVTRSAEGKPADVGVTLRYVEALQHGMACVRAGGRAALTLQLLNELHGILMREDERTGLVVADYRDRQAWIGQGRIEDAAFVPAPPECIPACMQDLEQGMLQYRALPEEQTELSIVAQLAIAHAQFETIHPYEDGNGRVGRLIMPLILAAERHPPLYLSGTLLRNRRGYYDALNSVQIQGNWAPWFSMVCDAVVEAADESIKIAQDLSLLVEEWGERTQEFRRDSVARRLPQLLVGQPVVSVKDVARLLEVSDRAALTGVDQLVAKGILTPRDERKWGRTFHARELVDRLNQAPR